MKTPRPETGRVPWRWFLVFLVVAVLGYAGWMLIRVILQFGVTLPGMHRDVLGTLAMLWVFGSAAALGAGRVIATHPFPRSGYARWLHATRWSPQEPLPFGPVVPRWPDAVTLVVIGGVALLATWYAGSYYAERFGTTVIVKPWGGSATATLAVALWLGPSTACLAYGALLWCVQPCTAWKYAGEAVLVAAWIVHPWPFVSAALLGIAVGLWVQGYRATRGWRFDEELRPVDPVARHREAAQKSKLIVWPYQSLSPVFPEAPLLSPAVGKWLGLRVALMTYAGLLGLRLSPLSQSLEPDSNVEPVGNPALLSALAVTFATGLVHMSSMLSWPTAIRKPYGRWLMTKRGRFWISGFDRWWLLAVVRLLAPAVVAYACMSLGLPLAETALIAILLIAYLPSTSREKWYFLGNFRRDRKPNTVQRQTAMRDLAGVDQEKGLKIEVRVDRLRYH